MGTRSFPGVKPPGRGADHPPSSSAEVEGRVELDICFPSGPSWPLPGRTLPLPLPYPFEDCKVEVLFHPVLPNFQKNIALEGSQPSPFVLLVRLT